MVSNAFDESKNTARVTSLNSCHWHLIYLSGAVRLGEQWCGFDESHTGVYIKGHVSRGSLQADCIRVFLIVLKKQGEYSSVCNC